MMRRRVTHVLIALLLAVAFGSARGARAGDDVVRLDDLVPPGLVGYDGLVLVMLGSPKCGASEGFRPAFATTLDVPPAVTKLYLDRPDRIASELKYYPTPLFVLFRDKRPVDILSGVVSSPSATFAARANAEIFAAFLARNVHGDDTPWALASSTLTPRASYDYQSVKYVRAEGDDASFAGKSFKRTLFTEAVLRGTDFTGATFERAIMAHVDLTGARLTDEQARAIVWVGSLCPDGTSSRDHGDTCVGHVRAATHGR